MEYKDYYKTLGVSRSATADEIKRSYRKLARKYHPDVSKETNAEARFKEVQEAYEVLKDSKKRGAYDQLGSQWKSGQEFRPPPQWEGFSDFESSGLGNENLAGFSDFFEAIFGARPQGGARGFRGRQQPFQQQRQQRGADQNAKIAIRLEEAYQGGSKTIQLRVPEIDAAGHPQYQLRTLKITIPPGILSGQQMRLSKQGAPGIGNGPPGDLFLEIEIEPHRYYTLQGKDVYLTLPITPWEAALGATVTTPTLGGPVDLKITPDSQAGKKLRLKGRGLPAKPISGDQYIVLQIVTPLAKTEAERSLYEKMKKEMPFNPRENLF